MCIDSLSLVPLFPPSLVYLYIKINYDFLFMTLIFMTLLFITLIFMALLFITLLFITLIFMALLFITLIFMALLFITLIFMALLFITLIYIFMQQQFGGTDFYTVCYEITDS